MGGTFERPARIAYFGGGSWPSEVDKHSGDYAIPYKVTELKDEEDTPLDAINHIQIEHNQKFPSTDFYEHTDILVISNHLSNHEVQFYHAVEHMPEEGEIFYEKALSPRYRSHKRMLENGVAENASFNPSAHYFLKSAAQEAEKMIFNPDEIEYADLSFDKLDGIHNIEIMAVEEDLDSERGWILTGREGGIALDYGMHAGELPVVNLDGSFGEEPVKSATGFDMNSDVKDEFAVYPEAFSAEMNLQGEKFMPDATMDVLMGKEFPIDQKYFRIHGNDSNIGEWRITGFYGTDNQPASIVLATDNDFVWKDLSDRPSAKKQLVDEYIDIWQGKEPDFTPENHSEIMRGIEEINLSYDLFSDEPETHEFEADIEDLESHEVHSQDMDEFWNQVRKVA